jgi:ribokinase
LGVPPQAAAVVSDAGDSTGRDDERRRDRERTAQTAADGEFRPRVVSLGSVNLDRVHEVTAAELAGYERTFEWFPAPDETVRLERAAPAFGDPDELHHGGKGANQAVAAAAAGGRATLLGKVGPDADAAGVRERLRAAGVDVAHVETAEAPTGTAHVFREPGGQNRIVVVSGANGRVDAAYLRSVTGVVRAADCLLLQNEVPAGPVVDLLDELAALPAADRPTVVLDPAPVAGAERLLGHPAVDCCTPNEHEYRQLRARFEEFAGLVLRKRGAEAVVAERGGVEQFRVTPPTVSVRDTTGAGDVFTGYLGTSLAQGVSPREAVETAAVAASLATRAAGAREGIPDADAVRAFTGRDEG